MLCEHFWTNRIYKEQQRFQDVLFFISDKHRAELLWNQTLWSTAYLANANFGSVNGVSSELEKNKLSVFGVFSDSVFNY